MADLAALGFPGPARPVHGGDINEAFRVETPDGPVFVKTRHDPLPGMYVAEAGGLRALREAADGLGVPAVLGVSEQHLALEWIESAPNGDGIALGRGLARIHRTTRETFGWPRDNWIGALPQINPDHTTVADFFGQARLLPMLEGLPASVRRPVEALLPRLPDLLPDEPPALVHGDLWGGNWLQGVEKPFLVDPAVAFGPREQDLAMARLFGGFPSGFEPAYREAFPLAPGFDERVDLWNLYPLLVHARLFGGGYGARAAGIARRFA